jgi:hypothetical protein
LERAARIGGADQVTLDRGRYRLRTDGMKHVEYGVVLREFPNRDLEI